MYMVLYYMYMYTCDCCFIFYAAVHPCWENNGKCSHLCLAVPSTDTSDEHTLVASCKCSTGYLLQKDGLTCQPC